VTLNGFQLGDVMLSQCSAVANLGSYTAPLSSIITAMDLGRNVVLCTLLLVGGCDSAVDGAVSADAPRADDAGLPSLTFEHDWREAELCAVAESPDPDCCVATRVELPTVAASLLDLRSITSGAPGTCGDPIKRILPSVASAYPLMVLLPAVATADPLCATACGGRGAVTTFGIVLSLPDSLSDVYRPRVVAPAPWRFVYDHNSLAGDACLGGYQEFGERACVRPNYGGAIGFATSATATPVRAALIELEPGVNGMVDTCCPYLPTAP